MGSNTAGGSVEDDERLQQDKELKVKLPLEQHLRLHALKVLTGKTISETVADALNEHFAEEVDVSLPTSDPGTD